MNLKRVSIRNEIFIRRDLSILHSIPHVGLNTDWIVSQVSFGIETNPDSCKLPLKPGFQSRHKHKHKVKHKKKQINSPALSQSEEISSDFCCFYGGGIRHNEDIMHSFQNFIVRLIPNHPPPLETRIWKLVVRALKFTEACE